MIYTELTRKAMRICYEAHKDQFDKGGVPYVFHPFHVAEQMNSEYDVCVALLHDVLEDTSYTIDQLVADKFPEEVLEAVLTLTKTAGQDYEDYIDIVKNNEIAVRVKLADLTHNSDLSRLPSEDAEKNQRLLERYARARKILIENAK